MAPKKGETSSTWSKNSIPASVKSSLSPVAKSAGKVAASTKKSLASAKRKAKELLSPKSKKKRNASPDDHSSSDLEIIEMSPDKTSNSGKGTKNPTTDDEDRKELG